jgi:hypothetical protein
LCHVKINTPQKKKKKKKKKGSLHAYNGGIEDLREAGTAATGLERRNEK